MTIARDLLAVRALVRTKACNDWSRISASTRVVVDGKRLAGTACMVGESLAAGRCAWAWLGWLAIDHHVKVDRVIGGRLRVYLHVYVYHCT